MGNISDATLNRIRMEYYQNNITNIRAMANRTYNEPSNRPRPDGEYQRDYTRIMYSSSFRRLQGKMQLLGIKSDQFFRNRLTHSLEVSQIARSIAKNLHCYTDVDMYVVEAAALAHDLGNPPFGHYGEKVLHDICKDFGGFEGNAQTLRILTNVEKKNPNFQGLNLTLRTLLSVVKYYKPYSDDNSKKFIYEEDYSMLSKVIQENQIVLRTLDAQILDLADEIAYAAHDLDDGLRQKSFIIDEILHDFSRVYGDSNESYVMLKDLIEKCKTTCGFGNKKIDSAEYSKLFRKELVSSIINVLINDVDLVPKSAEHKEKTGTMWSEELGFNKYSDLSNGLKSITFNCINHNDEVYFYEQVGEKVIKELFDIFCNKEQFLPPEYRADELIERYNLQLDRKNLKNRLIADYIAGMMDSFALNTYEKYTGKDAFKGII